MGGFEEESEDEAVESEYDEGDKDVGFAAMVVEPKQWECSGLKDDVQHEEELVPAAAKAAEGSQVEDGVGEERESAEDDDAAGEEEEKRPAGRTEDGVPNREHAGCVEE